MFSAEIDALTAEQELTVRKYINTPFFDVDIILEYLRNNKTVKFDIFENSMTPRAVGNIHFTWLKDFKELPREVFIKRVPIYFYDVNINRDELEPSISDLFESYAKYYHYMKKDIQYNDEPEEDVIPFRSSPKVFENVNYEPLYKMLEKVMYTYNVPFSKMLQYMVTQVGTTEDFMALIKWTKYIDLLEEPNESNAFPKNLLYAFNVELVKNGKKPIIYYPERYKLADPKKGRKFMINGKLPVDDEGNPAYQWIALWYENVDGIAIKRNTFKAEDNVPAVILNQFNPAQDVTLVVNLNDNSRIFFGDEEFDEETGESSKWWEQVYCGPRFVEYSEDIISESRESLGLSQKEVAETLGINIRTYQRIEAGETTPDALNMVKIMNYLGIRSYEDFIKKVKIQDDDFSKFNSGNAPSYYLDNDSMSTID